VEKDRPCTGEEEVAEMVNICWGRCYQRNARSVEVDECVRV
jgi:hypothetical protein